MNVGILSIILGFSMANVTTSFGQDDRNYVSPSDTNLKIDLRYNNAMRNKYHVGVLVGADVSTFAGGVYAEVAGAFSPKRFTVKGSYAFDVSKSDFFSKSPLMERANAYRNLQVGVFYHLKDEVTTANISPTVGVQRIAGTTETIGNVEKFKAYVYKTDFFAEARKTRGIGISFQSLATNLFYDRTKVDTSKTDFITFENQAITPAEFVLPYQSAVIGLSYQMSDYTSYKVRFKYKELTKLKYRYSYFKTVNFELLFAPSINHKSAIFQDGMGMMSELGVTDVKKRRLGFRVAVTTNQFKKFALKPGFFINGEVGMRPGIFPKKMSQIEEDDNGFDRFVLNIASQPFYMKVGIGFAF